MNRDVILNVILGIFMATVLYLLYMMIYKPHIKYTGPNSADIKNNIYKRGGKCWILEPVVHICPS